MSGQKKSRTRPATTTLVCGPRQPVRVAQLEAQLLQPAPHVHRARRVALRAPPSRPPFRAAAHARASRSRSREVEPLLHAPGRAPPRASRRVSAGGGEVEHGPGGRRDRQPVERRDVGGGQGTAAVKADARTSHAAAAADADVDDRGAGRADLPGMRGAEVAQGPRRRRRRAPRPTSGRRRRRRGGRPRRRRDTARGGGRTRRPAVDLAVGEPGGDELAAGDDPALAARRSRRSRRSGAT